MADVHVLQLGVEPEGRIHRPDVVVLQLEPLNAGVQRDGQHLQGGGGAADGERHLVTLAGQRAEPVRAENISIAENILGFCLKIFQPRQEKEEGEEGGHCGDHLKYTRFSLNIMPAQSSEGQSRAYNPIAR